jgi:hypothetical protein
MGTCVVGNGGVCMAAASRTASVEKKIKAKIGRMPASYFSFAP